MASEHIHKDIFIKSIGGIAMTYPYSKTPRQWSRRLFSALLCFALLAVVFPALTAQAQEDAALSGAVSIDTAALTYADGSTVPEGAMLRSGEKLKLSYAFTISQEQASALSSDTPYYLQVSSHVALPNLDGKPLVCKAANEEGTQADVQFATLHSGGGRAWIVFLPGSSGTVVSELGGVASSFSLDCSRATSLPGDVGEEEVRQNVYAVNLEGSTAARFGYWENQPVKAEAQLERKGSYDPAARTIAWTITYTPWQNPDGTEGIGLDTRFELREVLDKAQHTCLPDTLKINGEDPADSTRNPDAETYAFLQDGTTLVIGGKNLNAGTATQGSPAQAITISYQTKVLDSLLLPGGSDLTVKNDVTLFAANEEDFSATGIHKAAEVTVNQPTWLTQSSETHRDIGNGAYTDWAVTIHPNGFTFGTDNNLTLHSQLPAGSALVENSLKVGGQDAAPALGEDGSFTVSPIVTSGETVTITYRTHVDEELYAKGTDLGKNNLQLSLTYDGASFAASLAAGIGSGDSSSPAILEVSNAGYNAAARSIDWTVKINPNGAAVHGGTFTSDLSLPGCGKDGHTSGLELVGGADGVTVKPQSAIEDGSVTLRYENQVLTLTAGEIGTSCITLTYTTKICDPCLFANNTDPVDVTNTISTKDMQIGLVAPSVRSVSADSAASVSAAVLRVSSPAYDFGSGTLKWTVDVNESGLPMTDLVLTSTLSAGLSYAEDSLKTSPALEGAAASVSGQTLTIRLGTVSGKATVTFDTRLDPETLGLGGSTGNATVSGAIVMNGKADGVVFSQVSSTVSKDIENYGLVPESTVNNSEGYITYSVLLNPHGLALPANSSLVGALDSRLQLDRDSLRLHKAAVSSTGEDNSAPKFTKQGEEMPLAISSYDPARNEFKVDLPIAAGSTDAYLLTYRADILQQEKAEYSGSVRFDGGSVTLGGKKDCSASVSSGKGAAARLAKLTIRNTDFDTGEILSGVPYALYEWSDDHRGLLFAQGVTDGEGSLTFMGKPNAVYELVQEVPEGFDTAFLCNDKEEKDSRMLITAGAASSQQKLNIQNLPFSCSLTFRLVNSENLPLAGETVSLFRDKDLARAACQTAQASEDGTVSFPNVWCAKTYYMQLPAGEVLTVTTPDTPDGLSKITLPDGKAQDSAAPVIGQVPEGKQWTLTVTAVVSGEKTPLSGAVIGVYEDEACKTELSRGTTGEDGTVTFAGRMAGRTYWVREIQAPKGFQASDKAQKALQGDDLSVPVAVTMENTPYTADIAFTLVNDEKLPMAGQEVKLYTDPDCTDLGGTAKTAKDGSVKFPDVWRNQIYYVKLPGGEVMKVTVPAEEDGKITASIGSKSVDLTKPVTGKVPTESQWTLTVNIADQYEGTPVKNAVVGLYADEDCKTLLKQRTSNADGTVTFEGRMKGQTYYVKEVQAPDWYMLDPTVCKVTDAAPALTIENVPTGALTVSKEVTGSLGNKFQAFTFVVTLKDSDLSGVFGDVTFQDGKATFSLRHGRSVTILGIPAGTEYTIKEGNNLGYTVTKTGDTGEIKAGETLEAKFVNHRALRSGQPGTGDDTNLILWVVLMAVFFLGAVGSLVVYRKKRRSNR